MVRGHSSNTVKGGSSAALTKLLHIRVAVFLWFH
jgi:hypothetical protein